MPLLGRDVAVTGSFPAGLFLLETFRGSEKLGQPYVYDLGLLSKDPEIAVDDIIGKTMAVEISLANGSKRFFHGVVTDFLKTGITRLHTRYAARVNPQLSLLDYTLDCRVFNEPGQDALGIVQAVLSGRGLPDVDADSITDHPYLKRELCVQFREPDRHFAQRLLEEEGIYYFFRHEESKHTLVLADSITAHKTAFGYESVLCQPKERNVAAMEEHFWDLRVRKEVAAGVHTVASGYDPTQKRPKQMQLGKETSEDQPAARSYEHYDHPGGLSEPKEAQREAKLRTERQRSVTTTIEAEGNTMGLGIGDLVSFRRGTGGDFSSFWQDSEWDAQYLIVAATYEIRIDQYETGTASQGDEPFRARYRFQDSRIPFRPALSVRRPDMPGPQTARVVGPPGEEIWTDKLGRIRIQFDWDREGGLNEKSTCWVRVMQAWAGNAWGAIYIPRVGQEVVVRFLDGNPDRPVVTGALYSKDHMPPYDLPANRTKSGIKSRSTKGGTANNFNEISFEDKKGSEELHMQAERDMSTLAKNDQSLDVGVDRKITVGHNEENIVKNDRTLTVGTDKAKNKDEVLVTGKHTKTVISSVTQLLADNHTRKVTGNQEFGIDGNKDEHVGQAHTLKTDKKFQLNQGKTNLTFKNTNVTMNAAGDITLQAGGATVVMKKSGEMSLDSPTGINLVCGGSAVTILPGGVALSTPMMTAAAGGAMVCMGSDAAILSGKTVAFEAAGVCSIKGKSKLALQESEKAKGKGKDAKSSAEDEAADPMGEMVFAGKGAKKSGAKSQKGAEPTSTTLAIHVVELDGKPAEDVAFQIKKPDGGTETGKLDKDGRATAKSSKPGTFTVTFPDLDGADWDGEGAEELDEGKRCEVGRVTATAEDRVPAIARDKGFLNWRTVWNFSGNAELKAKRENPNVLWDGDAVVVPSKLKREATVTGGTAEFVLNRQDERVVHVRPLDFDLQPLEGIRYKAKVGDPDINKGVIPPGGFVTLLVPPKAGRGVLVLLPSDDDDSGLDWDFEIQEEALSSSTEHEAQRLINLSLGSKLPADENKGGDHRLAVVTYQSRIEKPHSEDAAIAGEMVAMHDGGDCPDDGGSEGQA